MSSETVLRQAMDFMENEKQFHLGFLPTEQSNPLSRTLEADFRVSPERGVATLQRVDREVLAMAERVLASDEFRRLVEAGEKTVRGGGRIICSGCGATGRLSILLESMWRKYCAETPAAAKYADSMESIMTGGDFALVRSVESFEDFAAYGRRQVADARMGAKDMLIAITEGGETSSVLGTAQEALDRGAAVFLMFNNPAELLCEHLERSRAVIRNPKVCVLDLSCGPMALAGSTRMQATTSEQLIAGAALERIMCNLFGLKHSDPAAEFRMVLDSLERPEIVKMIADYLEFEVCTYRDGGKITYFASDFLLDIFTDTTERSPTFMLPPFRRRDDRDAPEPWAFVKNPFHDTPETWHSEMHRPLRCLEWTPEDYRAMNAPEKVVKQPPAIRAGDLLTIPVGNEDMPERYASERDAAVLVSFGRGAELERAFAARFSGKFHTVKRMELSVLLPFKPENSLLELMGHMAVKLFWNTVSTGCMTRLGRVSGNWMSWVSVSNKKLLDRGVRLVAEIGAVDYRTACIAVFEAIEALNGRPEDRRSPVQYALETLRGNGIGKK